MTRKSSASDQRFNVALDPKLDSPLYVQIRDQFRALIDKKMLSEGERLPPVRALAKKLGVNQITIARAYRELSDLNLTQGRRGGGTYVRSRRIERSEGSFRRDVIFASGALLADRLYELSRAPGVIAFTSNYPVPDPAIVEEYRACLKIAIEESFDDCFHYDPPAGRPLARSEAARYLAGKGIGVAADHVLMTSGAQQAIDLVIRGLIGAGATAIVERPGYYGTINALKAAGARILEVPMEEDGMRIDVLSDYLARHKISLICINPTFQNPTGATTSLAKRREILKMARRYEIPILEDDHSSEWQFSSEAVPPIASLAETGDQVLYVCGLGKWLLPGQRFGILAMPPSLWQPFILAKAGADLHGNGIMQEALGKFLERGRYIRPFERMRSNYALRQATLYKELSERLPDGAKLSKPDGGLSFWLGLPDKADVSELYFRAVRRGVAFLPGETFFASNPSRQMMRVSFGLVPEEELLEGVVRLSGVVRDLIAPASRGRAVMV